jgi:hypothetical protein
MTVCRRDLKPEGIELMCLRFDGARAIYFGALFCASGLTKSSA